MAKELQYFTKETLNDSARKNDIITFICKQCNIENSCKVYVYKTHPDICFKCNMSNRIKEAPHPKASEETKQKLKEAWKKRDSKKEAEKRKQTCVERYGVDNVAKAESSKQKAIETNIAKYGVEYSSQSQEVKNKAKQTILNKYGTYSKRPCYEVAHQKFIQYRQQECDTVSVIWLDKEKFRGKYDENGPIYYNFECKICGRQFKDDFHSDIPTCRNCHPYTQSKDEEKIWQHIDKVYDGTVVRHDRKVLNGKELDIYLPDLQLAIEYNGIYWHGYRSDSTERISEFTKKVEEKRLLCKEKGIKLINIDEADFIDRPDVYLRFIDDLILPRKRVFARNCEIREIDLDTARDFCNYYHVNGYRGGSTKLGLYYNNELIVVAVFGRHPKYKNECIRLCYKTGYDVIGGWAKICKHFGKPFLHYVNLKYFDGENKTGCGYRFWYKKRVFYRNELQKENLAHYLNKVDPNVSAFQNCLNNGAIAIFDVGNDIRFYNVD